MTRQRRHVGLVMALLAAIVLAGCVNQAPDTFPKISGESLAQARVDITKWCSFAKVVPAPEAMPPDVDESAIFVKSFVYTPAVTQGDQTGNATSCPDGESPVVTLNLYAKMPDLKTLSLVQAQSVLATRGISFGATGTGVDGPLSLVLSQDVPADQQVPLTSFPSPEVVTVTPGVAVPDLAKLPAGQVCRLLKVRLLGCGMPTDYDDLKMAGFLVTTQDPPARTVVAEGAGVSVQIAPPGSIDTSVPNVVDLTNDDACATLAKARLSCAIVSGPVPGRVVEQIPAAGELVGNDSSVAIVLVSLPRIVPNVVGMSEADACRVLSEARFGCAPVKVAQGTQQGVVVAQEPSPGRATVASGDVTISVADILVAVPDVRGQGRDAACRSLEGQRLACGYSTDAGAGKVTAQNPAPGTAVLPGTLVSVSVPAKPTVPQWAYAAAALIVIVGGAEVIRRVRRRHRLSPANVQVLLVPGLPAVRADQVREW